MRRVFLPKWIRAFVLPVLAVMWAYLTYQAFFTEQGRAEVGTLGWLVLSLIFVLVGVMLWLMSSGKLPAYLIEDADEDERSCR